MKGLMLALACVLPAAAALPGAAHAQVPLQDSAYGSGHVLLTDFAGSTVAGPNGEAPVGSLTVTGFLEFTTTTTCFNVSGNAVVSGHRIETGPHAGEGFLSSAVDHGPPVDGRPVDEVLYSGFLPRPPVNCPSPGDPPPLGFVETGYGPLTSGDITVVDAVEQVPGAAPPARVEDLAVALRRGPGRWMLALRARVCGRPGMALLRFALRSSTPGRARPVRLRSGWRDELRQDERCRVHRTAWPLGGRRSVARQYQVTLRARTTSRRWSRAVERRLYVAEPPG
jgi:hypothetical protein